MSNDTSRRRLQQLSAHLETIRVTPLTPTLGAEVTGVDLANLSPQCMATIDKLFLQYKVLFFREQTLDSTQQIHLVKAMSEYWEITPRSKQQKSTSKNGVFVHPFLPSKEGFQSIWPVATSDGSTHRKAYGSGSGNWRRRGHELTSSANVWHSDNCFLQEPSSFTVLRACDLPSIAGESVGGDTIFVDMSAAYEDLAEDKKRELQSLVGLFHWQQAFPWWRQKAEESGQWAHFHELAEAFPVVEHPVIRTHPRTGSQSIFVNETFTVGIKGMPQEQSAPLLEWLYSRARVPEYQCRFRWRNKGDVAIWDNRLLQHYAVSDYGQVGSRSMEHTASLGEPTAR
jgi:taurine dioxygenase